MGIILIGVFSIFITLTFGMAGLISAKVNSEKGKRLVHCAAIVIICSPFVFLYLRDYVIAQEYEKLCNIHQGVKIINDFDSKVINFKKKGDSDLSIWRLLFENPELKAVIEVKNAHIVQEPGIYILSASTPDDDNCSVYNKYFEDTNPNWHAGKVLRKYPGRCIAMSQIEDIPPSIELDVKDERKKLIKNSVYSISLRTSTLTDPSTDTDYISSAYLYVYRSFKLFEFSTLFKFDNYKNCPSIVSPSETLLLAELLSESK